MKSILYATDFSKASESALKYAASLSRQLNMRLVVTHVYDVPTILGTQLEQTFPELRKDALVTERKRLTEFCETQLADTKKLPELIIDPVENMSIHSGIIAKATDWHVRMIIVGMKGENAIKDTLIGSTAKKLIEKSPCPVLTVPNGFELHGVKRLVYATDFELEDLKALEKVVAMAKTFDAEILVIHISMDKEYSGASQMAWFKEMLSKRIHYDKIHFEVLESADVAGSIKQYSEQVHAGLIAMLERAQKGLIKKWFHRDTVKHMASSSSIPLLSFNEKNLQSLFF